MSPSDAQLPDDRESLVALVRSLLAEREGEKQRAQEHARRPEELQRWADDLHLELLRAQLELERYKKWYYGPRADRLQSAGDLAQLLLTFAEEMDRKAVHPEDVSSPSEPQGEVRRVKRRKGRRNLANFESLPVTTQVYELSDRTLIPIL